MRAEGLRVSYPVPLSGFKGWFQRGRFVAVQGADLTVPPGRTLGVVGESGSGKSTLALAALRGSLRGSARRRVALSMTESMEAPWSDVGRRLAAIVGDETYTADHRLMAQDVLGYVPAWYSILVPFAARQVQEWQETSPLPPNSFP